MRLVPDCNNRLCHFWLGLPDFKHDRVRIESQGCPFTPLALRLLTMARIPVRDYGEPLQLVDQDQVQGFDVWCGGACRRP